MSGDRVKLLLVDDREDNLLLLEALLGGVDVDLLEARSGAQALEILEQHDVSLALIDVQMPNMDGFELAEKMRASQRTGQVPIIFLTAASREQHRVFRGYEAGAVDFLFKPIDAHILRNKVGVFVELGRHRQQVAHQLEAVRRAEDDLRFLAKASEVLGGSLALEETLNDLGHLVVPRLGDWCALSMLRPDGSLGEHVVVASLDPAQEDLVREMRKRYPPRPDSESGIYRVLRTGKRLLLDVTDETLTRIATDAEHLGILRRLHLKAALILPLMERGKTVGTISLATSESGRTFGQREIDLAEELARRASMAIENARLFERTQNAVRTRDDLLAIVSHDLRNPLGTIMMAASTIVDPKPVDHAARERNNRIEMIRRSATRMNRLIDDLLDFASIERGNLRIECQQHDAESLVRESLEALKPLAAAKSLDLVGETKGGELRLSCDRERVLQIVSNLVGNAIKFTPSGGRITITAEASRGMVVFTVADTGQGVPAEQLPHIFDRYWQAKQQGRTGVGLGLSIVKGLVEAHGGRIWAESVVGRGTTIHFTLSVAPAPAAAVSHA
ncbi:MAG: response regulator [Polyangiaceae bacterium]|nr:response regulator [Polyangiaceae bacterium]